MPCKLHFVPHSILALLVVIVAPIEARTSQRGAVQKADIGTEAAHIVELHEASEHDEIAPSTFNGCHRRREAGRCGGRGSTGPPPGFPIASVGCGISSEQHLASNEHKLQMPSLTGAVVFLHGTGDCGQGMREWVRTFLPEFESRLTAKGVKVFWPDAGCRHYSLSNSSQSVWFDRTTLDIDGEEDAKGIDASYERVLRPLLDDLKANGVGPEKVVLGGFSQGGGMSLQMLRLNPSLRGIFVLSSYLYRKSAVYSALESEQGQREPPTWMAHGDEDGLVKYAWANESAMRLQKLDVNVSLRPLGKVGHGIAAKELRSLLAWVLWRLGHGPQPLTLSSEPLDRPLGSGSGRLSLIMQTLYGREENIHLHSRSDELLWELIPVVLLLGLIYGGIYWVLCLSDGGSCTKAIEKERLATSTRPFLHHVSGLRAIACLWIVAGHWGAHLPASYLSGTPETPGPLRLLGFRGQIALCFFVVLSGFMMRYSQSEDEDFGTSGGLLAFYVRRLRVLPMYHTAWMMAFLLTCFGFCSPMVDFGWHDTMFQGLFQRSLWSLLLMQAWTEYHGLLNPDGGCALGLYLNPPLWTVSSLFFCWLVYPLLAALLRKVAGAPRSIICLAAAFYLLSVAPFIVAEVTMGVHFPGNYCSLQQFPPFVLPIFAFGASLAELQLSWQEGQSANDSFSFAIALLAEILLIGMVILAALIPFLPSIKTSLEGFLIAGLSPILASCIMFGTNFQYGLMGLLSWWPIARLGEWSFHIYVFQMPFACLAKGFADGFPVESWPRLPPLIFGLYMLALVSVAAIFAECLEKPYVRMIRDRAQSLGASSKLRRNLESP